MGCAEAYICAAELTLSLPNGRSVEILPVPPPKAVAQSVGGPTASNVYRAAAREFSIRRRVARQAGPHLQLSAANFLLDV